MPPMDTPSRRSPGAPAASRPDRKLAILQAAERLFATRGYHAVSIRQIAEEAGVPVALVGYYYGHKDTLFHALFAQRAHTVGERMAALRAALRDPPDTGQLRRIVEAFVTPVLRLRASPEGVHYALLITVGLSMQKAPEADRVLREFFDPMAEAFIDALHTTLRAAAPGLQRGAVAWGYQFALGALLNHLCDARVERLSHGACSANDPAAAPMLVDFIVHGLQALVRRPTGAGAG